MEEQKKPAVTLADEQLDALVQSLLPVRKAVRKEAIEELVMRKTVQSVFECNAMDSLVEHLMMWQAKENTVVPLLQREPEEVEKSPENMARAIEQGIINPTTKKRLGLRWLWNQPEVTCVLSGMNSEDMVNENIRIASEAEPRHLTEEDMEIVEQIKQIIREREKVSCTGCRYCMPCPKGVDIPGNFYYYNLMYMEKKSSARFEFAQNMGLRKEPGFALQCIGCWIKSYNFLIKKSWCLGWLANANRTKPIICVIIYNK